VNNLSINARQTNGRFHSPNEIFQDLARNRLPGALNENVHQSELTHRKLQRSIFAPNPDCLPVEQELTGDRLMRQVI
jgi:hypothetical protein